MVNPDGGGGLMAWPFPQAVRLEVAEASVDLCKCFDGAEQAHRKENLLTGSKGEVKVCPVCCRIRHRLTILSLENLRQV
jgi:hypothetical protein